MAVVVKYRKGIFIDILRGIAKPITNAKPYFTLLNTLIEKKTTQVFQNEGDYPGHPVWPKINLRKYQYPSGRWAIRRGSDGTPKAKYTKGDGKWRKYRGNKVRRWGPESKALQASGLFQKSFKKLKLSKQSLYFGTKHQLAELIMSNPWRPVVYVSDQDLAVYQKTWHAFLDRGMTFENLN